MLHEKSIHTPCVFLQKKENNKNPCYFLQALIPENKNYTNEVKVVLTKNWSVERKIGTSYEKVVFPRKMYLVYEKMVFPVFEK